MMRTLKWAVPAVLGLSLLFSGCDTVDEEPMTPADGTADGGYKSVTVSGITLRWKVEDPLLLVEVRASTTGWVAVGFDPTTRMQNANLIIGYVSGGEVFVRDDYGSGLTAHQSDESGGGTSDVTILGGQESNGTTQISFSIPLDSGDSRDRVLTEGNVYPILLSRGPDGADNFGTQHSVRTSTTITL